MSIINNLPTWSLGESVIWYSPNIVLDTTWSLGESILLDIYMISINIFDNANCVDLIFKNKYINIFDNANCVDLIFRNKYINIFDDINNYDYIITNIITGDRQGYRLSEAYESAIYNWAYSSLGSYITIIWDKPNAPRPELPYVTLAILGGPIPLDDRPQNQYKSLDTWTYTFRKRITLSINVFGYDDCFSKAQLLADSLYLASKILILNSAGIACYGTDGPRDMSQFIDTQWEFRAQLDVFLSYGMTRDDSPGEVQKIGLNGRTIEII